MAPLSFISEEISEENHMHKRLRRAAQTVRRAVGLPTPPPTDVCNECGQIFDSLNPVPALPPNCGIIWLCDECSVAEWGKRARGLWINTVKVYWKQGPVSREVNNG